MTILKQNKTKKTPLNCLNIQICTNITKTVWYMNYISTRMLKKKKNQRVWLKQHISIVFEWLPMGSSYIRCLGWPTCPFISYSVHINGVHPWARHRDSRGRHPAPWGWKAGTEEWMLVPEEALIFWVEASSDYVANSSTKTVDVISLFRKCSVFVSFTKLHWLTDLVSKLQLQ